jgi:serine/threonine-protein kinase
MDAQPTTAPPAGLLAGRYRLERPLGAGGMGTVWLAHDETLQRAVAVKLLPEQVRAADAAARFRREAQALARLNHPNIIQAHDHGDAAGRPFLVMEYVEGRSLAALLAEKGALPPTRVADYGHQAASALQHAHEHGLVHRDLKPSNLLVGADGRVKLLDLGLARFLQDHVGEPGLTREGVGMGTPDYAAPEQFRDARSADARSDIYSLGCALYHLLCGRVPFPGSSLSEKYEAHEKREPTPLEELAPEAPAGLALAVRKMMAKRPDDRFQTASEAAEALAPYVASSSASFQAIRNTTSWDGGKLSTMTALPRRRQFGLIAAALVGVIAYGGAAGWFRPATPQVAAGPQPGDPVPKDEPKKDGDKKPDPKPPEPGVLRVSQNPKDRCKYPSIKAALKDVRPGQTIRVLDDAVYEEAVALNRRAEFRGVTLEAPRRATLKAPPGLGALTISNVPGVVVRGWRVRGTADAVALIVVRDDVPGCVLEELDVERPPGHRGVGVALSNMPEAEGAPVVVRRCVFRGGVTPVLLDGRGSPCRRALLRDNSFEDCGRGIFLTGDLNRVAVVGNRFRGVINGGVAIYRLGAGSTDLLVANNTFHDCGTAVDVEDTQARPGQARFLGNLTLSPGPRDWFRRRPAGPGVDEAVDGAALLSVWGFAGNWRENRPATADLALGRIPPGPRDVSRDVLEGVERDPKSPTFLRPEKGSPPATQGAGNEDPRLPRYVGALPPEGEAPWDWERAWKMPPDPQLLTVSKAEKGGGTYRKVGDALKDAKPWATIRVLDAEIYTESLTLNSKAEHRGITLEAPKHATLAPPPGASAVNIRNVPDVVLCGWRVAGKIDSLPLIVVADDAAGITLDGLEIDRPVARRGACMIVQRLNATADAPLVISRCLFRGGENLLELHGHTGVCRCALVRDNIFEDSHKGVILAGNPEHVWLTGNRFRGVAYGGVNFYSLGPRAVDVLVAGNTFHDCGVPVSLESTDVRPGQAWLAGNLTLEPGVRDWYRWHVGAGGEGPVDGTTVAQTWRVERNWRETPALTGEAALGWVPPGPKDVRRDRIDGIDRDPKSPRFLRPDKGSPLAAEGPGQDDPTLPPYVGALPPEGVEPWDWDRTWRARVRPTAQPEKKP